MRALVVMVACATYTNMQVRDLVTSIRKETIAPLCGDMLNRGSAETGVIFIVTMPLRNYGKNASTPYIPYTPYCL